MIASGTRVAVVGSGFGGLCMGIQLKRAGHDRFTIFEKEDRVGGTWRANTYPGCECDIPSALYSYSFAPYAEWPSKWSDQPVILKYLEKCVDDFGIRPHLQLSTQVSEIEWIESEAAWRVRSDDGSELLFDVVVSSTGQLSRPRYPSLPGVDSFSGTSFHSAAWDHGHDLHGCKVGVVGSAASAIQFVPEIAPVADRVYVFQRSANWILRKNDRDYSELEKKMLRAFPPLSKIRRFLIWFGGEALIYPAMKRHSRMRDYLERRTIAYLQETISAPELRAALIPDYPMGAKRILFSDNYYAALARENVQLVSDPIAHIEAGAVVSASGERYGLDTLIFATGFDTKEFLAPMRVIGLQGELLNEKWAEAPQAFLGLVTTGFPNLFFLYGPNTNLGHSSIVIMLEAQVRYIMSCLRQMGERAISSVDVRAEVLEEYDREIQQRLADSSWAAVSDSWYVHAGRVTNNWPGRTTEYRRRLRHCHLDHYELTFAGRKER